MSKKDDVKEWPEGRSVIRAGVEVPDPRPMSLPVGFERPPSIQEMIRRLVTDPAIRAEMDEHDIESFDEADDFDIAGEDPISPHEDSFDPMHLLARDQEVRSGTVKDRSEAEIRAAKEFLARHKRKPPEAPAASTPPGKE